jgi:hypothetical protein
MGRAWAGRDWRQGIPLTVERQGHRCSSLQLHNILPRMNILQRTNAINESLSIEHWTTVGVQVGEQVEQRTLESITGIDLTTCSEQLADTRCEKKPSTVAQLPELLGSRTRLLQP